MGRGKWENRPWLDSFVIENKSEIVPIEVKAAKAGHLKSLFHFCKEKKKSRAVKISLADFEVQKAYHKLNDQQVEIDLYQVPHYAVEQLEKILNVGDTVKN